jgi:hypothetical protein
MRGLETIDSELPLLAAVRRVCREQGGVPSMSLVDALLDERLAHRSRGQRGRGSRDVAAARTPLRRIRDTSSSYGRPGTSTAGDPRASGPVPADGLRDSSAAAASSTSHRCSGRARRLRAWCQQ